MRASVAKELNKYARQRKMTEAQRRALKREHSHGKRGGNTLAPSRHERNVARLGRPEVNRRREQRRVLARRIRQ